MSICAQAQGDNFIECCLIFLCSLTMLQYLMPNSVHGIAEVFQKPLLSCHAHAQPCYAHADVLTPLYNLCQIL